MKKLTRWLKDIFAPEEMNDLNTALIGEALNDPTVRSAWLLECLNEIKRVNLDVDRILLADGGKDITDLCARRKAYQDILESVLSIRRKTTQEVRHNPRVESPVDLDRVTA